jgi:hypothetical protein
MASPYQRSAHRDASAADRLDPENVGSALT